MSPRFIDQLKPVDFKAVAAKGCFVYCYLRANGTPYYVGIATRQDRPFAQHTCGVPRKHPERVRSMRSGLSWEEACQWEIYYISRYGRIDLGTGILRNQTNGGDGLQNPSPITRNKIREANLARAKERPESFAKDDSWREKVSKAKTDPSVAARYGFTAEEWRLLGTNGRRAYRDAHRRKEARLSAFGVEAANAVRGVDVAARYGILLEKWVLLGSAEKARAHARYKLGHRGEALLVEALPQPPKPSRSASYAARYNICPLIWMSLSKQHKERVRDRFSRGIVNTAELLDFSDRRFGRAGNA